MNSETFYRNSRGKEPSQQQFVQHKEGEGEGEVGVGGEDDDG